MRTEIDTTDGCITNKRPVTLIARAMSAHISFFPFLLFSFFFSPFSLQTQTRWRTKTSFARCLASLSNYRVFLILFSGCVAFHSIRPLSDATRTDTHHARIALSRALSLTRRCKVQRGRSALVIGVLLQWERRFCSYNPFDRSSRVRCRVPFSFDRF